MLKRAVKGALRKLGYELKNISGIPEDEVPAWTISPGTLPEDDVVPGLWVSSAIEMVTNAHRPAQNRYHRRVFGEDYRIKYVASFLDVRGLRVLELGPQEGYWSVLLEKMGVRENISVELRSENIQKCRRIKELHRLDPETRVCWPDALVNRPDFSWGQFRVYTFPPDALKPSPPTQTARSDPDGTGTDVEKTLAAD